MTVEVLYVDDCPSHARLMPALRALADGHDAQVTQRRVNTPERADEARFLGSPSVHVNGRDIEPGADDRSDYGMKCRLYRSLGGQSGVPPREWIERALNEAAG